MMISKLSEKMYRNPCPLIDSKLILDKLYTSSAIILLIIYLFYLKQKQSIVKYMFLCVYMYVHTCMCI